MSSSPERYFVKAFDEATKTIRVTSQGSLIGGVIFDKFSVAFPTSTTEVWSYEFNSVVVAQVRLTYSDASKKSLLSGERL